MSNFTQDVADPLICIVRTGRGERIAGELAKLLNPVDPATFHQYRLRAGTAVELHYHDYDEYWWFTQGTPRVTLRTPNGKQIVVDLGPGDMVACVRGVEHTLFADHELVYFQFSSKRVGGERNGHQRRTADSDVAGH